MKGILRFLKTILKIMLLSIAVLLVLLTGSCAAAPVINDHAAKRAADELSRIPLPEKTELIEVKSAAGKLTGSGNGMQYFGAILIRSGLPLEELNTYYSEYAEGGWSCAVQKQEGKEILLIEHGNLEFETEISSDDYYIVYSWGSGDSIFSELDLRGH